MKNDNKLKELETRFRDLLLDKIKEKAREGQRTYGIEYEFLPKSALDLEMMEILYRFLREQGFRQEEEYFRHPSGIYISFEPGGQIEYHCVPLLSEDVDGIDHFLDFVEENNLQIDRELGIEYMATGYIPDRGDSPLCLKAGRYINLHSRMPTCGSRGLEMMKGTASIHLHVVIRNTSELPMLFSYLCRISKTEEFRMKKDRRIIWDNTDPGRCGLPYKNITEESSSERVAEELVKVAIRADDISENIPFYQKKDLSADAFLYHMTTMFTDVRLNFKGPSVELRTLDSMPFSQFKEKLKRFIFLLKEGI